MGNDELGQLAGAVNNLSVRVEEAQESSDSERRRLDSILSHMSDGVDQTQDNGNHCRISEIRVVDSKSIVRGTSNADNRGAVIITVIHKGNHIDIVARVI